MAALSPTQTRSPHAAVVAAEQAATSTSSDQASTSAAANGGQLNRSSFSRTTPRPGTQAGPLAKPQTRPLLSRLIGGRPTLNSKHMAHLLRANTLLQEASAADASPAAAVAKVDALVQHCHEHKIALKEVVEVVGEGETIKPLVTLISTQKAAARALLERLPYGTYADGAVVCTKSWPRPPQSVKQRFLGEETQGWGVQFVKYGAGFKHEIYEGSFARQPKERPMRAGEGELTLRHNTLRPGEERVLKAHFVDDAAAGQGTQEVFRVSDGERKPLYTFTGNFAKNAFAGSGTIAFPNGDSLTSSNFTGARFDRGTYTFANGTTSEATCIAETVAEGDTLHLNQVEATLVSGDQYKGAANVAWGTPQAADGSTVVPDGEGTLKRPNGESFVGSFAKGLYAKGTQTLPNQTKRTGTFVEGELSGLAVEEWPNGDKLEGKYTGGQRQGEFLRTPHGEEHPREGQLYVNSQASGEPYDLGRAYRDLKFGNGNS